MKGNSLVVVFKFGLHGLGLIDVRFGFSVIELAIPRVRPGLVAYGAAPVKPIARRSLQTDWGLPRLRKRMPSKRSPDGAQRNPGLAVPANVVRASDFPTPATVASTRSKRSPDGAQRNPGFAVLANVARASDFPTSAPVASTRSKRSPD